MISIILEELETLSIGNIPGMIGTTWFAPTQMQQTNYLHARLACVHGWQVSQQQHQQAKKSIVDNHTIEAFQVAYGGKRKSSCHGQFV